MFLQSNLNRPAKAKRQLLKYLIKPTTTLYNVVASNFQKNGPKKIGPKIFGPKKIGPKKIWSQNNWGPKKIGSQKIWSQKNWSQNIGPKKSVLKIWV